MNSAKETDVTGPGSLHPNYGDRRPQARRFLRASARANDQIDQDGIHQVDPLLGPVGIDDIVRQALLGRELVGLHGAAPSRHLRTIESITALLTADRSDPVSIATPR